MKTLKTLALATAVSASLLGSVTAMAAVDGNLDTTSTGNFDITYVKGNLVRIWGLEDVAFDNLTTNITATKQVCVFSNGTNKNNQYSLTVTSTNGDSGNTSEYFALANGTGQTANYTFEFASTESGAPVLGWSTATRNSTEISVAAIEAGDLADQPDPNVDQCDPASANAQITITVPDSEAPSTQGVYTDNLTLLVAPI